jgi:hypothetical protein
MRRDGRAGSTASVSACEAGVAGPGFQPCWLNYYATTSSVRVRNKGRDVDTDHLTVVRSSLGARSQIFGRAEQDGAARRGYSFARC